MAIEWQVLGQAGADNALFVTVDSGQSRENLLFDCGEGCLRDLRAGSVQAVSHLLFSHFHMDHVSGFDSFFRLNYNRADGAVQVWGPPGTIEILWHRFRGFSWNLHRDQPGEWVVRELSEEALDTARFFTREAFSTKHPQPGQSLDSPLVHECRDWRLEMRLLPHGSIPSAAYRIVESAKKNIDAGALRALDLIPGPWLKQLSDAGTSDTDSLEIDGRRFTFGELRERLLQSSPGDSLAYLTDFRVEPGSTEWNELVAWIRGTGTLVCECQYRAADATLAAQNHHMTADLVGRLASEAEVGRVVLHHFSRRYAAKEWLSLRDEAKSLFPRTDLPPGWTGWG